MTSSGQRQRPCLDPARVFSGDVFRRIFFSVSARDICHASAVSKLWNRLLDGDNQVVWKNAVLRRWHRAPVQPVPTGISWKQYYRNSLEADFMWARRQYETQYLPVQCFGVRVVRRQRALCWDVAGNVIVWDLVRNAEERRVRANSDRIWWLAADSGVGGRDEPSFLTLPHDAAARRYTGRRSTSSRRSEDGTSTSTTNNGNDDDDDDSEDVGQCICVTASNDRTVAVLDVFAPRGHEVLRRLVGHEHPVWCADVSVEADLVASGSDDDEMIVWRLSTGQRLHTVRASWLSGWYDVRVLPLWGDPAAAADRNSRLTLLIDASAAASSSSSSSSSSPSSSSSEDSSDGSNSTGNNSSGSSGRRRRLRRSSSSSSSAATGSAPASTDSSDSSSSTDGSSEDGGGSSHAACAHRSRSGSSTSATGHHPQHQHRHTPSLQHPVATKPALPSSSSSSSSATAAAAAALATPKQRQSKQRHRHHRHHHHHHHHHARPMVLTVPRNLHAGTSAPAALSRAATAAQSRHDWRCASSATPPPPGHAPQTPCGAVVLAAARQGVLQVDPASGHITRVFDRARGLLPNFLTVTPDASTGLLYTSDTTRRLCVWSLTTGQLVNDVTLPGIAECVLVHDDKLYTGIDENGLAFYIMVWSISERPAVPEYLYTIDIASLLAQDAQERTAKKGQQRLYSVEICNNAILCCTQAEKLVLTYTRDTLPPRPARSTLRALDWLNTRTRSLSAAESVFDTAPAAAPNPAATARSAAVSRGSSPGCTLQ